MGLPKSYIQKIGRFWRGSKAQRPQGNSQPQHRSPNRWMRGMQFCRHGVQRLWKTLCHQLSQARRLTYDFNATGNGQPCPPAHRHSQQTQSYGRLIWVVALISLTAAMSHPYLSQPQYGVDTIAPRAIHAPYDATIVDQDTTETLRQEARTGVIPVLSVDPEATEQIADDLRRLLVRGDEIRQLTQPFPVVTTAVLSEDSQRLLRDLDFSVWRSLRSRLHQGRFKLSWFLQKTPPVQTTWRTDWQELEVWRQTGQRLEQLQNRWPPEGVPRLGDSFTLPTLPVVPPRPANLPRPQPSLAPYGSLEALMEGLAQARSRYQGAIADLNRNNPKNAQVFSETLLSLSPEQWDAIKDATHRGLERLLLHGIPPGITEEHLKQVVSAVLTEQLDADLQPTASRVLMAVANRPNLFQDDEKTKERAETAAENVEVVEVSRQQGELIVAQGDRIDASQFALLDYYGLSRRAINGWGILKLSGLVAAGLSVFWLVERRFGRRLRRPDHILLLLLAVSAPLSAWAGAVLPGQWGYLLIDLPLVGLLAGSFYGPAVGGVLCLLVGLAMPVSLDLDWSVLIAMTASGGVGALMAGRLRSREEFAFLGVGVGFTQGAAYLLLSLISSAAASSVWSTLLGLAMIHGVVGLIWSVVALGFSPYLEHLFDLVTPIRLAELSNPNRTLLKRLAADAPGTFQHTMFVASLAEAAARTLGCNVELVRAGTLYHDIGKMHDPLGFIENQMGGPNKHDAINDPWKSVEIIKRHVSEGIVMAKKARLPKAIQAFIPEHQGTMCISYFYHQAMQQVSSLEDDEELHGEGQRVLTRVRSPRPVCEVDFRYAGPIPQSKETGIVMLADSCEAALRSLKDATYEEALAMVNRILRARWQDNQLVESGLTRPEMTQIAEVFVRVWQQVNHQRIAYPKAALPK